MEEKSLHQSRTFWGVVIVLLSALAPSLGLEVDQGSLTSIANQIVAVVGAFLAVYGRIKAERPIRFMAKGA
ncbi:MAG: hypothetical protein HQL79_07560 [Magnetococcales bacterium]|nr:hypothetical protein [Magnetococcales bacterium]